MPCEFLGPFALKPGVSHPRREGSGEEAGAENKKKWLSGQKPVMEMKFMEGPSGGHSGRVPSPQGGLEKSWAWSLGKEWRDRSVVLHGSRAPLPSPAETGSEAGAHRQGSAAHVQQAGLGLSTGEPWIDLKGGHDIRTSWDSGFHIDTVCPVKCKFQINSEPFFSINMSQILYGTCLHCHFVCC